MISDYEHQIKWIVCAQTVATAIFYVVCLTLLDYCGNILSNLCICFVLWLRVYSNLILLHLSFYSFNLGIFDFIASAKLLIFQLYGDGICLKVVLSKRFSNTIIRKLSWFSLCLPQARKNFSSQYIIYWQPRPLIMWNPRLISEDVGVGFNVRKLRRYFLRYVLLSLYISNYLTVFLSLKPI